MAGKTAPPARGLTAAAARRGVTLLLLQDRLRLVLDTLASASYSNQPVVPNPNTEAKFAKKRDETVQSNVLALSVVMPWARDEVVRPVWGEGGWIKSLLWILFLPFILIWTPSPAMAIQSVLHALSAPVKLPGDEEHRVTSVTEEQLAGKDNDSKKKANTEEITDPRRNGVRQGEVVRDCGVIE
jgi:hypothetical protein